VLLWRNKKSVLIQISGRIHSYELHILMPWKQYIQYHLKWQSGFFITWPVLMICTNYFHLPLWTSTIIFQFVGAIVFWYVDKWIFRQKNNKAKAA